MKQPAEIDVIAPNLKRRLSGVTATIVRLVPLQARQINIVAAGPGLPPTVPTIPLWRLPFLPRNKLRVWHARRNTEMLLGIVLRSVFRRRLRLVFTSASQRDHSRYTKWLIARMDAVVATSRKTASYLEGPATVVLHGIDVDSFRPAEDKGELRKRLGLPDGVLIGCYGRIRHQKGTDIFVDAMIEVLPDRPDAIAVVMGRATSAHAEFLDGLKAKVAKAGLAERILFLNEARVDEMARWYQVLDLFVAPQRWEGFGLTPLEAMACGVPVVAGNVGAFEEQIVEGKTGRIVEHGDVAEMVTAVNEMLSNHEKLRGMGDAARAHVLQNFRIEKEAATLVALYRDLLDEEKG